MSYEEQDVAGSDSEDETDFPLIHNDNAIDKTTARAQKSELITIVPKVVWIVMTNFAAIIMLEEEQKNGLWL